MVYGVLCVYNVSGDWTRLDKTLTPKFVKKTLFYLESRVSKDVSRYFSSKKTLNLKISLRSLIGATSWIFDFTLLCLNFDIF